MFKYIFLFVMLVILVPGIRRFLMWLIVGRFIAKEQKRANDIRSAQMRSDEVKTNPKSNNNDGQYVDFQEIK